MRHIKSFEDFKNQVSNDPNLQMEFKADPVDAINKYHINNPLSNDKWIYRIIVIALGFTIVSIVIGTIILMAMNEIDSDVNVPTILTAIGSAAIGALAGLLATPPKNRG